MDCSSLNIFSEKTRAASGIGTCGRFEFASKDGAWPSAWAKRAAVRTHRRFNDMSNLLFTKNETDPLIVKDFEHHFLNGFRFVDEKYFEVA